MATELDHLIWAVPDLDQGVGAMEKRTGVRAAYGGRHPGVGTHNAILDLGDRRYLEILAPDPTQTRFSSFGALVRDLREPKLLSWAVRTDDVRAISDAAQRGGLRPGVVLSLSRRSPSGVTLSWRLMQIEGHKFGPVMPIFIEWRTEEHPSRSAPSGCVLQSLAIQTPGADSLRSHLGVLGLTPEVREAGEPGLQAELVTPSGPVALT